jgi:hypothetical protein
VRNLASLLAAPTLPSPLLSVMIPLCSKTMIKWWLTCFWGLPLFSFLSSPSISLLSSLLLSYLYSIVIFYYSTNTLHSPNTLVLYLYYYYHYYDYYYSTSSTVLVLSYSYYCPTLTTTVLLYYCLFETICGGLLSFWFDLWLTVILMLKLNWEFGNLF